MFVKIIKIGAEWCAPCKQEHIELEKFKKLYPQISIIEYDAEEDEEKIEKYNIKSLPTLIYIDKNDDFIKKSGFQTVEQIKETCGL